MGKKGQTSRGKFSAEERKRDAKGWIRRSDAANMVAAYSKRYGVRFDDAYLELMELGHGNRAAIAYYEARGIEWEYQFPGGEETICPKSTKPTIDDTELFKD